jgi:hypothetical protein
MLGTGETIIGQDRRHSSPIPKSLPLILPKARRLREPSPFHRC